MRHRGVMSAIGESGHHLHHDLFKCAPQQTVVGKTPQVICEIVHAILGEFHHLFENNPAIPRRASVQLFSWHCISKVGMQYIGQPRMSKTRQAAKIREFCETLIAAGYVRLDEQARVLGLSRSTTWTMLQGSHKNSGLSASVVRKMLSQPQLPAVVRTKIYEYVDEKSSGMYGHNRTQVRLFVAALSSELPRNSRSGSPDC